MKLEYNDFLEPETVVAVSGKIGKVIKADLMKDQFGGDIVVHTVRLTHKINYSRALDRYTFIPLNKVKVIQPNYSFVYTVNEKLRQAYENKI